MTVDELHALVSSAIWRAEQLDGLDLETSTSAWAEVSRVEEELAKVLSIKDAEGRIARRGAVRAALKAKDYARAQDLAQRYAGEPGAPRTLSAELRDMLKADANVLSEQFPFAARHYKPADVQAQANRLHQGGPFGLAA
ncbi:MAG: hypothetical protein FJ279_02830 [Planctomycetes bacterium]|nr:hypothetical protein [Planctomycetota bacterium]MBM4078302.1 hypothetical protein [Planctomycetota bacterium]MBM4083541.1 hypothetical protein [Planctomycetota bacterium]